MSNMAIIRLYDRSVYALNMIESNNIRTGPIDVYTGLISKSYSLIPQVVQDLIESLPSDDSRIVKCKIEFDKNVALIAEILKRRRVDEIKVRKILESIL